MILAQTNDVGATLPATNGTDENLVGLSVNEIWKVVNLGGGVELPPSSRPVVGPAGAGMLAMRASLIRNSSRNRALSSWCRSRSARNRTRALGPSSGGSDLHAPVRATPAGAL